MICWNGANQQKFIYKLLSDACRPEPVKQKQNTKREHVVKNGSLSRNLKASLIAVFTIFLNLCIKFDQEVATIFDLEKKYFPIIHVRY